MTVATRLQLRFNGKTVAVLRPDGVLRKVVKSRHMLLQPVAWAIQTEVLDHARALGAHTLEIVNSETRLTYSAPIVDVLRHGIPIDRAGYGPQVALPISRWQVREG